MPRTVSSYSVKAKGIGLPDYAAPAPVGQVPVGPVHTLTDVGELAARLKSGNTFDRRGNVLWLDDFEDALKWEPDIGSGSGGSIALSAEAARSGAGSCKMTCPDTLGGYAQIRRYSGYPVVSKIGSEISFTLPPSPGFGQLLLELTLDDGTDWIVASVFWDMSDPDHRNHTLLLVTPTGGVVFADDLHSYLQSIYCFHTLKLVADFVNKKYLRFILDHRTWDLSEYDLQIMTGPLVSIGVHLHTSFYVENNEAGTNPFCYADDSIITQNEPDNP